MSSVFGPPGKSRHPDEVALSYHNTNLRMRDVLLLNGKHWMNDTILQFYFEYMERSLYRDHNRIMFVAPAVTHALKFCPDHTSLRAFIEPLNPERKDFIFFPVNNNSSVEAGGTHWTLLVFSRPEKTFFHYDSISGASALPELQPFIINLGRALECTRAKRVEGSCKIQVNGYDCGMHVLYNAEVLAQRIINYGKVETVVKNKDKDKNKIPLDDIMEIRYVDINHKRTEMLKLIETLGGKLY